MTEPEIIEVQNRSAALDDLVAAFDIAQDDGEIERLSREIEALEFELMQIPITNRTVAEIRLSIAERAAQSGEWSGPQVSIAETIGEVRAWLEGSLEA